MSFFDPVPEPPPRLPSFRTPEWLRPPDNVVPGTAPIDLMLVRRPGLAVWLAGVRAYPCGLAFELMVHEGGPEGEPHSEPPMFFRPPAEGGPRFGLRLADGTRVVTTALHEGRPLHDRPGGPVLRWVSGGGGMGHHSNHMWLWPLPPPGATEAVFTWPAKDVDEVRAGFDTAPVLAAAQRAVELWPDDRPLPPRDEDVLV